MINFNSPKEHDHIIKVIGVGGGGSNAVNTMFKQGIRGVDFLVCNTDAQALEKSPVPMKVQLGSTLTEGRGAGSIPEKGKNAALEDLEEIKSILSKNTKMVFITAGMGGGTGTGAAPVIACAAREMGILTVAIVTIPFAFEGRKRKLQAEEGIKELRKNVDTLLIICNDKLRDLYGNLPLREAFNKADNILTSGAKGIAEIITVTGYINVDFEDIKTVMANSGVAIMGTGIAEGENRAVNAIEMALSSPLLNDNNIRGAKDMLLYISSGNEDISMDEISEITDYITEESGSTAEIIWGNGIDEELGENISITIVATGFDKTDDLNESYSIETKPKKIVHSLNEEVKKPEVKDVIEPSTPNLFSEKKEIELIDNSVAEKQSTLDFTLTKAVEKTPEKETETTVCENNISEEIKKIEKGAETNTQETLKREMNKKMEDRYKKLKELSYVKSRDKEGVDEMESVPAYQRKNVQLSDVTPADESQVSRYTLDETENNDVQLRPNNSYLHDNVD